MPTFDLPLIKPAPECGGWTLTQVLICIHLQHRVVEANAVIRQLFGASEVDQVKASMGAEMTEETTLQHSSIPAVLRRPISRMQLHVGVTLQVHLLLPGTNTCHGGCACHCRCMLSHNQLRPIPAGCDHCLKQHVSWPDQPVRWCSTGGPERCGFCPTDRAFERVLWFSCLTVYGIRCEIWLDVSVLCRFCNSSVASIP